MDPGGDEERCKMELDLIQAMYPSEVSFNSASREVTCAIQDDTKPQAKLSLRLPDDYPSKSQPIIISALVGSNDVRKDIKAAINDLPAGEEALDAALNTFQRLAADQPGVVAEEKDVAREETNEPDQSLTVIVWLHHLLSTTKRKTILAPPGNGVSGVSKPGYPGVILLTGPAQHVREHIRMLREMNWQAFQIRAEIAEHWHLTHKTGVVEAETMADVVDKLGDDERKKSLFLESMKIR